MASFTTRAFESHWHHWRQRVDAELLRLIGAGEPEALWASMKYSVEAGGKRLRPLLVLCTLEALGRDPNPALPAACAIELVHTFSLIHDDLPALDDDSLRRGLPTNHKVFGEATAILAGDALHALAFRVLSKELLDAYPAALCLEAVHCLADAAVHGLACGQVADLRAGGCATTAEEILYIHDHKTGSLFRCAVQLGAILGSASPQQVLDLDRYASSLGLAFQVADDILDVVRSAQELGKSPGKDARDDKATYVRLYGLAGAHARLEEAGQRAADALASWGDEARMLRDLAAYVVQQAGPRASVQSSASREEAVSCPR
ncbi:MAG: polyprenyl synthetase family protein [Polyangiales bacterium]